MAQNKEIYLILGSSCSGKSSYVRSNADSNDLIFDFDTIHQAISTNRSHIHLKHIKDYVFEIRKAIYSKLKEDKNIRAWIINSTPYKENRQKIVDELGAEIIYLKRSKDKCLEIAKNERPREWLEYIENYHQNFEDFDETENVKIIEMDNKNIDKRKIDKRHIDKIEENDTHYIIHYLKEDDLDEEIDDQIDDDIEDDVEDDVEDDIDNRNNLKIEGLERRNFNTSEIRVSNKDSREVVGYASVFNSRSENLGGFKEIIEKNAFDSVLDNDVRALFNHDPNLILGRSTAGTLSLSVDDKGLEYKFSAPDTSYGNDLIVNLENGNITQSSFGFIVEEDDWEEDEDGMTIRTIKKVGRLLDVSPVTYPAYPEASVGKRSFMNYRTKLEKKETQKQDQDLIRRNLLEKKLELLKLKNVLK